tara:strand:+ start:472 stop:1674 length:1203 start_codon:yes stop_codon:yes gene_type:complete
MKIGITVGIRDYGESLWINGMKLNAIMLAQLLNNSTENYEVMMLQTVAGVKIDQGGMAWSLEEFPTYYYKDKIMECDLVILLGGQIQKTWINDFKKKGGKVVFYKCGNSYVVHLEDVLFREPNRKERYTKLVESNLDELWYVPQQHECNEHYYKCIHRMDVKPVPFVWHPRWLDKSIKVTDNLHKTNKYKEPAGYQITGNKKRLTVMEPNLNIVKYSLYPLMIAETSYRGDIGKENIEHISITNGKKIIKSSEYPGTISNFDLLKDGKIFVESRYPVVHFLSQHSDILLCHQLLNPLNYLYLDAAYMGYPVLHNAWMCPDVGYYYNNFDVDEGSKMLDKILTEHDKDLEGYKERNQAASWRYNVDNPELVKTYDRLIDNLMNNKKHDFGEYDHLKNSYTK